jgi:hypothetical protein
MQNRFPATSFFALALCQAACTFYTSQADPKPCPSTPTTPGNSGGSSNTSGGSTGAAGNNTVGVLSSEPWTNATSNLAGLRSGCGNLGVLASKPNENLLIAGVAGLGLWASEDGGGVWTQLGMGQGSEQIGNRPSAIVFDPDDANRFWESGIYGDGVYRTDDRGNTFARLGDIVHSDLVAIDFDDPDRLTLLAGGHEESRKLSRSTDGGDQWESIGANLPNGTNCTLPLILGGSFFVGCGGYGSGPVGIYRSDDADTWSVASETGGGAPPLVTRSGNVFWANPYPGGLTRSLDGGDSWEDLQIGKDIGVHAKPTELPDGRIAVLGRDVVWVSDDDGDSFQVATDALPYSDGQGVVYSENEKAFFIWHLTCADPVPDDAIMRSNFDYDAH